MQFIGQQLYMVSQVSFVRLSQRQSIGRTKDILQEKQLLIA